MGINSLLTLQLLTQARLKKKRKNEEDTLRINQCRREGSTHRSLRNKVTGQKLRRISRFKV